MKKNAVVIIIIAIILILIGVAVYLFVKGSKKGKNLDKDGKIIDPTKDKDGKLLLLEKTPEVTPPLATTPTPTPTPTYTAPTYTAPTLLPCTKDAFPMGMGAKNQCVQKLQQKLNEIHNIDKEKQKLKLVEDGKFGKNTNTAVLGLGFVVPLTQADYDAILEGLGPVSKTMFFVEKPITIGDLLTAKKLTPTYISSYMEDRFTLGATDGRGNYTPGNYIGTVIDTKKQTPLGPAAMVRRAVSPLPKTPTYLGFSSEEVSTFWVPLSTVRK